jgi:surface polysaccharide O-acyltransferase-like enzyme
VYFPVPFFFIVSGYFIRQSLNRGKRGREILRSYSSRLVPLYLFWVLIYATLTRIGIRTLLQGNLGPLIDHWRALASYIFKNPWAFILTGRTDHLWFIASLIIGCVWLAVLTKIKKESWILPLGMVAYVAYLATTPYAGWIGIDPWPFIVSRGCLVPVGCMSLGYYIRLKGIQVSTRMAAWITFGGFVIRIIERLLLITYANDPIRHPFLLGTPLMALGIFLIALSAPRALESSGLAKISPLTLGIYAASVMIGQKLQGLNLFRHDTAYEFLGPVAVYLATIALVYFLSKVSFLRRFLTNE